MVHVVKEYRMLVLSDETIRTEEMDMASIEDLMGRASSRINQTISVIREVKKMVGVRKDNKKLVVYLNIYNIAVTNIAKNLSISKSSVRDKLERKLSLSAVEIQDLLKDWIENGSDDLESKILNSTVGSQKEENDQIAIREFFRRNNNKAPKGALLLLVFGTSKTP